MQDRSVISGTGTERERLLVAAPHAEVPDLRTRAGRSLRQVLLRRGAFATAIAIAALIVSYHYGGLLGTGQHETLHQVLGSTDATVVLPRARGAIRHEKS